VDLACDVSELLSRLPSQLREVAELLGSHPKRQIASQLGISRRTLDRRIDALRAHFAAAGLDEIP
jgi:FixJ family two-component response regulator